MSKERWIKSICNCGCEKITVPYHLKDADLWVSTTVPSHSNFGPQDAIRFTIKYEEEPDSKGWVKK